MKCVISGGTGFIGKRLVNSLLKDGHYVAVWTRTPGKERRTAVQSFYWDPLEGEPQEESINAFDVVVHLAGEPVAQRWDDDVKRKIRDSRVLGTQRLVSAISKVKHKPSALICSSAVGYYGSRGDEVLTENSSAGTGFLADACVAWERAADEASKLGLRVAKIRTGIALGRDGGALEKMLPAFRAFAGGTLGSGKQWMPWIHVDDLVAMYRFAMDQAVSGALNGSAPNPVTNAKFTSELGQALHRPAFLTVPAFALETLYGEMSQVILTGQRAVPEAAQKLGFQWKYPRLGEALHNLLDY
jgi:uncharacterized protein (TIGR01777 family)